MPPQKIKNIIFDLGNTLVYFDHCYFYDGVARLEKKLNANKFRKYILDKKLDIKLAAGRLTHKSFFRALKKKFGLRIGYADFIFLYSDIFWENAEMSYFLDELLQKKKYKLFLLSNTDSAHYNYLCKNFPAFKSIKNQILSYKVKLVKPDKKIFRYLLSKYRINPEETLLIDDMKVNIEAAKSLKINCIQYKSHKLFKREFKKLTSETKK